MFIIDSINSSHYIQTNILNIYLEYVHNKLPNNNNNKKNTFIISSIYPAPPKYRNTIPYYYLLAILFKSNIYIYHRKNHVQNKTQSNVQPLTSTVFIQLKI